MYSRSEWRNKERDERMRRLVVIKMVLVICLMGTLPLIKVEAKSSIYAELLGSGLVSSLNYEYYIKDDLPIRIGNSIIGFQPIITLSKLIGKGRRKLELGGGLSYVRFSGK